ncbi:pseudouridine-5'-phosphate glycosidase [Saccharothrix obliqua]|uniref:pseudouridine-5'-phosphate glycosidase n=1 Tax=Saccharothrix obliqua TaxID=2861747 RepID=UPI001C5CE874|nr:pseudouridine-5'-phosphate glycosidase [Saccharothrix obliqua]MBW4721902.1 pseudouridine-5'-phosphate glycosidase [Saccharothrix obliqua]
MTDLISVHDEVADAVRSGQAVVALESSAVAHGLKYPMNLDTARDMAKAVRAAGAVPARVGIVDGRFVVGMTDEQIERFATTPGIPKVSTRDVGPVIAGGGLGATTVSSTLLAAAHAGIEVFATAGIGGVHFNAQETFDVSPDLIQFTRHRVAVVCAGAKSILDPALTLEYLETHGIPVVGYRCDDFPAYYSVSSGQRNPRRVEDLGDLARGIRAHWAVGNEGAFVVTHPIAEADALPSEEVYALIHEKMAEARREGVSGPEVTPHILGAVAAATKGATAEANRSVLLSTTALAGEVAVALAREAA